MVKSLSHEKIVDWVIPGFLAVMISIMGWIGITLQEIRQNVAVHNSLLTRLASDSFEVRHQVVESATRLTKLEARMP